MIRKEERETECKIFISIIEFRKMLYSFLITLGISSSSVIGTQAIKRTYKGEVDISFLLTYFTTLFNLVLFPLYLVYYWLFVKERKPIMVMIKECIKYVDINNTVDDKPNYLRVLCVLTGFTVMWLLANYTYIKSLAYLNTGDVSTLFSTSNVFVFLLSLIILKEQFYLTKLFSIVIASVGVVLFFYSGHLKMNTITGIILALLSAFSSALYKVLYKLIIKHGNVVHVLFSLTIIGIISCLFSWIFIVVFHFIDFEKIPSINQVPWLMMFLRGFFALIMNFLINFGIAYTSSIVVSIGALLSIPINATIDYIFYSQSKTVVEIIASILIVISFLMIIVPDRVLSTVEPFWKRSDRNRIVVDADPL